MSTMAPTGTDWYAANQRYLTAALNEVRALLEGAAAPEPAEASGTFSEEPEEAFSASSTLDVFCRTFELSPFERHLLLLCAGMELDAAFPALCTQLGHAAPTFGLALAALPNPHWSALLPTAPLRHWRLIDVGTADRLVASPLRIDERILHYLTGLHHLDESLMGFVQPVPNETERLVPTQHELATRIAEVWAHEETFPIVQLYGREKGAKRSIAAAAAAQLDMNLYVMPADALPAGIHEFDVLRRLWTREAILSRSALLLDADEDRPADPERERRIDRFLEESSGPLLVAARERRALRFRPTLTFEVSRPMAQEQRRLWKDELGDAATGLNGQLDRLVAQFDLSVSTIQTACTHALSTSRLQQDKLDSNLWNACRAQVRPRMDDLAERIEPAASWDDLVLPPLQRQMLDAIVVHVRQRMRVYETWGFAAWSSRGLGISALFAGASGTGKTMAAEVLAAALHLDLYRIDLSRVVSKYIGETEKNLGRVFDAAEEGGALLLFDEADALFGKRSEVKDSHDRYANIEVSYLLQRMEAYRGLAILTTNLKDSLDDAFTRRIRFFVTFPFPDAQQRAEIWRRIFPAATPTDGLDVDKLARLSVTGGSIRNIALQAAFWAADADEPVRMPHLLRAARSEYAKLEKPLTDGEIRGWN